MVHLAFLPRTCPFISPVIFFVFQNHKSILNTSIHTRQVALPDPWWQNQSPIVLNRIVNSTPQAIHLASLGEDFNLEVYQSINVCDYDIPSYSPQVARILQLDNNKKKRFQVNDSVRLQQIQRLKFLDSLCLGSMTLQGHELLLVCWESRYETKPQKMSHFCHFFMDEYHE